MILTSLVFSVVPAMLPAEDTAGLKPMVCATLETYDCGFGENCTRASADDIDLPVFLNINFEEKIITGTMDDGSVRTTKIQKMEQLTGGIIIQGIENGLGFSLSYNSSTRKITGAVSGDQVGFVIFGACKPE
jgi:hypothetical protein